LAVSAHNNNTNSTAVFDNVTFTQTPLIAAISNQTLMAGQTLTLTNSIVNPDTPPLSQTWALSAAPSGVNLNSSTGVLNWRPTMAQAPSTNTISVQVTDSGSPPLSATQSFITTVLLPMTPILSNLSLSNGVFSMLVNGTAGPDYLLQATTNLNPPVAWQPLQTNFSPTPPFSLQDSDAANFSQQFYRLQLGP
jgi:hypothetical protein